MLKTEIAHVTIKTAAPHPHADIRPAHGPASAPHWSRCGAHGLQSGAHRRACTASWSRFGAHAHPSGTNGLQSRAHWLQSGADAGRFATDWSQSGAHGSRCGANRILSATHAVRQTTPASPNPLAPPGRTPPCILQPRRVAPAAEVRGEMASCAARAIRQSAR